MDMIKNSDILESTRLKVVRLSNQLIVGNFSSPHQFTFDDGTKLDAVSDYDSMRLKVDFNETLIEPNKKGFDTISLDFTLSDEVKREMEVWMEMHKHNDVDIVLCPLPMIQAFKLEGLVNGWIVNSPFRAVRMKDRILKTVSCDTFTI
jgi:hypothetical protein|tara:strand:+ start:1491 stop:1934 length:444 start_codon:yes stop_codon:yes gene_type:complete